MFFKITINLIRKNIAILILLLIFFSTTNFFYNIYAISVRDYDERMLRAYNYCGGISYGFVQKIQDKFLIDNKKIYIINFELNPSSYGLFYYIKKDKNKNNLILLNFDEKNKEILNNEQINLNQYQLIEKEKNCLFYKKI